MSILMMKVAGPLQSWGVDSRFQSRTTEDVPSKSGILGLLAAALGRDRDDNIDDLAKLNFGIRVDQPGRLLRDFQTAKGPKDKNSRISTRYYLTDAVFLVALEGPDELISLLLKALHKPRFPLFLGRRSCPANHDLFLSVQQDSGTEEHGLLQLEEALRKAPWQAKGWFRDEASNSVRLRILRDAMAHEKADQRRDVPVSFSQGHRQYRVRSVKECEPVVVKNPDSSQQLEDKFFEAVLNP